MEKQYNHSQEEQIQQAFWRNNGIYAFDKTLKPLYSIDTPPPTVSGTLHIGHIFSYTQTDIIARYKRMSGFTIFYPFGFDDNGLPTERYVEKKLGVSGHSMSRSAFIELCLQETIIAEEQFKNLWQKMGLSVDWQYTYATISPLVRKISQESFIRLFNQGFVYRKQEPALYCTSCYTSVAQAELDDHEISSLFNDILFTTTDGEKLIIGTTRPEFLASCVAVLYNPADARHQHLKNKKAIVPFYNYEVPFFADEGVNIEKGTGLVMCCTFGDKKDIEWYKKFNLPYRASIGRDGRWTGITGPLAGLKVQDARKKIIELLQEKGLLAQQKQITHTVNIHERCKKEIEFLEIPQWFINILDYKKEFVTLTDKINWHPAYMKSRYINWVENLGWDWCISRQRFYGIPFPVWHCQDCNKIILAELTKLPVDPQESKPAECTVCKSKNLVADTDVMDTWNTSSLTPQICFALFNPEENPFSDEVKTFMPMGMRPQAHDIIRTWAFDTIVKAWMHNNDIPWHDIVISGHVLAGKEKLSKSKDSEAITPVNLLERYPADAIRFWTASGSLGQDISFSESQLKIGQRLITKLWNAFKFCQEHIDHNLIAKLQPKDLGLVNEWLLHETSTCFERYKQYLDMYEFGLALTALEQFFWADFCDNYLELIKNQLFNPKLYKHHEVEATIWTLHHVGLQILQMYAPYVPHVTESIYRHVYQTTVGVPSIHQTRFTQYNIEFTQNIEFMNYILHIISLVRRLKTEQQLSLKTELATLTIASNNKKIFEAIGAYEQLLKGITQAIIIEYVQEERASTLNRINDIYKATIFI